MHARSAKQKNASFQSINYQPTVFLQPILGSAPANTRELHLYVRLSSLLALAPQAFPSVRALHTLRVLR